MGAYADGIVAAVLAAGWLGGRRADWREEEGGRAVHTVSQGPAPAPQTRFPASGSASGRPHSAFAARPPTCCPARRPRQGCVLLIPSSSRDSSTRADAASLKR